jgi:hypothetical protein
MILSRSSTLWGFVVVCSFFTFSARFIPDDSIMEQQTNDRSRAEYDGWIRPYTSRPAVLRHKGRAISSRSGIPISGESSPILMSARAFTDWPSLRTLVKLNPDLTRRLAEMMKR